MGDPTNRNDPEYSQDSNYVWSGGRWQYVQDPNARPASGTPSHISATTTGTGFESRGDPIGGIFGRALNGDPRAANAAGEAAISRGVNAAPMFGQWNNFLKDYMGRAPTANPYDAAAADRSRGAQLALMQQMRGMQSGPSVANMQGQRALGQSGQQALMNAAMGGGRGAMLQSANVGAGLAGDVGQARLGEMMRSQAGIGGAAGNLRGGDLRSADARAASGNAADRLTAGRQQFGLGNGINMAGIETRNALENYKFGRRVGSDVNKSQADSRDQAVDVLKNYLSMLVGFGAKGAGGTGGNNTGGGK